MFVVLSSVLVPPFFLLPQLVTVLSLNCAVVMLMSPEVASRYEAPVEVMLLPLILMSLPATKTRFPSEVKFP